MITLCAATETEIALAIDWVRTQQLPVHVLITGVGMLPASFTITEHIFTQKPKIIIQAGLAGSLRNDLAAGTLVVVKSECIGDAGVEEAGSFRSLFAMGLEKDEHPWSEQRLVNPHADLLDLTGLPQVAAVTVNEVSTAENRIDYYRAQLGAEIESMEGAALHFAGIRTSTPFLQIRSVSNLIGERDKSKWQIAEAITNLNTELVRILKLF